MKRSDQIETIVNHLAENFKKYSVPKTIIAAKIREAIDLIKVKSIEALKKGEKVDLIGFGAITIKDVSERQYRNIHTGSMIKAPAQKRVSIKPSKSLKEAVKTI